MNTLLETLQDPIVSGVLFSIGVYFVTEISKRFKIESNTAAFILSLILGTIYVLTIKIVPESILEELFIGIASVFGTATAIYKVLKMGKKKITIKAIK